MPTITMYSTGTCPYCAQAENLFKRKGLTVNKIRIDQNEVEYGNMIAKTGKRTVPQIYIDDHYVGGFDNLTALDREGQLATLLKVSG
jgi:glutaredoxin 3